MHLIPKQSRTKEVIEKLAPFFDLDPLWATAIAMEESSLGINQLSSTGCKGIFQMSSIAMKDLLQEMEKSDDDIIDIASGLAFLHLLLKRHKTIEQATDHFCDPADRPFYFAHVSAYMKVFAND
ncbi:MAG: hypothetical protein KJ888_20310 [Gammaproteobacteria bacterium]|nr:hypothetical protein [Gammaproteobacteria bacterium]